MAATANQTDDLTRGAETETEDWLDSQRTGPGTLAGRYLRTFWQPLYRSEDLAPGRAVPMRVMSEDITLYRGEGGTPHAVAFRCAHRGTQLSTGWVEGDNLRCFYHGWMYGPDGQCVEQPAEPEPFCQRIHIRGFPCEEYLGLVFVYLGEGEPPALPRYPDFEGHAGQEANIYFRRCNFFNHMDNDSVHTWFVHRRPTHDFRSWLGTGQLPRNEPVEDEWGVTEVTSYPNGRQNITHRGMPNIGLRKYMPGDNTSPRMEHTITWLVPVDDDTHIFVQVDVALRANEARRPTRSTSWVDPDDLAMEVLAGRMEKDDIVPNRAISEVVGGKVTDIVKFQDSVVQVGQGRIADRGAEHLGRTDARVILWRSLWTRELSAFAAGRPVKPWHRPKHHITGL
jgi:5,5'-dehydrodivanillate O-demethylase